MKRIIVPLLVLSCLLCGAQGLPVQGIWSGDLNAQGTEIYLVFHFSENGCMLDSPDQGVKGIPAEAKVNAVGGVEVSIPSIGATYSGVLLPDKIVGTFTQRGMSFPLTLTPGERKLNRPQTPQPPFPYSEEEVTFRNREASLSGTLTLPVNCTADTPVLVLVTGSGLQDRDETLFEHKPFAVIADFFAREGIATLRYDDRGMGESTGDLIQVTTEDLKNDARAGISLLQGRFKHVGVLGHSEGGSIAFMLAAERQADFIISLAGGILSGKAILLDQNRTLLLRQGISEDETEAYCAALSELFDRMILGQGLQNLDGVAISDALKANLAAVANQNSPYMQYFLQMDVSSLLDRVDCPVMAINGDRDTQVNAALNMPLLEQRFWADPRSCIKIYPELNHLFQHCVTGDVSEYKEIEETLSPEVLSDLVSWIRTLRF